MKISTTLLQQQDAVLHVSNVAKQYKDLLQPYYDRLLLVYKELNTFTYPKKAEWSTTFKVNKLHEVSNKILPRIVSRSPKWIVSVKPDLINEMTTKAQVPAEGESEAEPFDQGKLDMQAMAVQDLLSVSFSKQHLSEPIRLWAKGMVNYGIGFAKITTKYDLSRKEEATDEDKPIMNEDGSPAMNEDGTPQTEKITKKISEKVANQYSTIEPVSWTDMLYDPRYIMFKDMPAVIHIVSGVRLSELKGSKKYINTDKLDDIVKASKLSNYKEQVQSIVGFKIDDVPTVDKNNLTVMFYYGLYDLKDDGDERLYRIGVANGLVCVVFEEITQIPFEQIRCFEDTETNIATGFLEAIVGLQQELNYKKNSASEYINHALNRSWVWSSNSGVNPKRLISRPNNIIPTTKSVDDAMKNLQELPHRQLDASYFQEQNDFERQIQGLTFTVDTNNSANANGLTNTATGIRVKFFESNVVIDEVRKHFEEGLERLAYKLLQEIAENMDENLTIKQMDDTGFREIHKDAIIDSLDKFEINIEAGTTSYDTIENRREDAIAKFNIGQQAAKAGTKVDMDKLFEDTMGTFEGTVASKYIKKEPIIPMGGIPGMPGMGGGIGGSELPTPEQVPTDAAAVTEAVAKGGVTEGL